MIHTLLAARTYFSLGESMLSIKKLVAETKALGANTVAVVDTMSVNALIELTGECKKQGVKPIIGCRLRFVDDHTWRKPPKTKEKLPPEYFITWYCRSQKGLEALFQLLSLANDDDHFYFTAKLGWSDIVATLAKLTADDVALASSDAQSMLHHADAQSMLAQCAALLNDESVFLTLTPAPSPLYDTLNRIAIDAARALSLPTLVTYPTLYSSDGADTQEIMMAVSRNVKVTDAWHWSPSVRDFAPHGELELVSMVKGAIGRLKARGVADPGAMFKAGLENTSVLADTVDYVWSKAPVSLPVMATDEVATLVQKCKDGWTKRFKTQVFGHTPSTAEQTAIYLPRLKYELGVLKDLNFAGYFLLVTDIVNWSKDNGIAVGPGRGSVGGSLVAYLLGITECDPIRFGLLFERFINPGRTDLPDADLDFMSARRHEVIGYITEKWGKDKVAGISNYQVLHASSAIRDVGRVCGLELNDVACSKFVPKQHGIPVDLATAVLAVPEIAAFRATWAPLWKHIEGVEGTLRSLGRHAAGVVVSGVPLIERGVVERRSGEATVNWDKRVVEEQGLVKMDILGLTTLDLMVKAVEYIRKRHGKHINLGQIPLDDEEVLAAFAQARTTGVFQFESGGMKRMLKDLGAGTGLTFDECVAVTALYRPGPMDTEEHLRYIDLKHGHQAITYDHPLCEPALKETYGVMTYQEQVMQLSRDLAGFTLTGADDLRKAMGKKDKDKMATIKPKFIDGAKAHGIDPAIADEVWQKMETFAGYGFNKSHGVEYTLISFQAMWLKVKYPIEFFAAALSVLGEDKLEGLVGDASTYSIEILPPDINLSSGEFEILTDTKLCIPFNRCKGISDNTTSAIMAARAGGPFVSKADLIARVERKKCNVKHQAILDAIGAFASVEPSQLPATHDDRLVDQREYLPGLVVTVLPIQREMHADKATKEALSEVVNRYKSENADDGICCRPTVGKAPRFMVITDDPTWAEEMEGQIGTGKTFGFIQEAMDEAGLVRGDGYWTSLIKRRKAGKVVAPDEIARYLPYLYEELALVRPPLILCLGTTTSKHFVDGLKGNVIEFAGKTVYDKIRDANIIVGFNPAQIAFDPDKQALLNALFQRTRDLSF